MDRREIEASLRKQSQQDVGFIPHNRHPQQTTMHKLGARRSRRRWRRVVEKYLR